MQTAEQLFDDEVECDITQLIWALSDHTGDYSDLMGRNVCGVWEETHSWYVVSDELANHLRRGGALVVREFGLQIWCRTDTALDPIEYLQEIGIGVAA